MCPIGSESLKRLKKKDIKTQLDRKKSLSSKQAAKVSRKKNLKIFQSAKKEDTYESSKDVGKRLTSELKKKKKRKQDDDEEEEESTSLAKKRKLNWKFKNKFKFEKKNICEKMKNFKWIFFKNGQKIGQKFGQVYFWDALKILKIEKKFKNRPKKIMSTTSLK